MKTLTIKTAQNIPIHSSYIIEVDGKKIGLLKPGETGYFDIDEDAKSIVAKMQGAKTNTLDISENQHHALMIDAKKLIFNNLFFFIIIFGLSFGLNYFLNLDLEYFALMQLALGLIFYLLFRKTKLNTLKLTLIKNI